MCHPLVLGSVNLPPISHYARDYRDETDGQIYVGSHETSRDALAIFSSRLIYGISTRHTGDACGFYGEYREAHAARRELADFLARSLDSCDDLQLYVALTNFGDLGVVPSRLDYLGPSDIVTWMRGFTPGDFFQVIRDD